MSHNEVLLRKAEQEKDDSMYMRHLKIQMKLNEMKGQLGKELGTVVFK